MGKYTVITVGYSICNISSVIGVKYEYGISCDKLYVFFFTILVAVADKTSGCKLSVSFKIL